MINGKLVQWTCQFCGYDGPMNTEDYELTALPMCADCGETSDWEDILLPEEQEELNNIINPAYNKSLVWTG